MRCRYLKFRLALLVLNDIYLRRQLFQTLSRFSLGASPQLLQPSSSVSLFRLLLPYHQVLQFLRLMPMLFLLAHPLIFQRNMNRPMDRLLLSYPFLLVRIIACYAQYELRSLSVMRLLHLTRSCEVIVYAPLLMHLLQITYVLRC